MRVDDTIEVLVKRAQRGDTQAFEPIVRQCLRPAYLVALTVLGRPPDAEDVAQEALITVLERIDTCREPKLFRSWMFQIVRNHARNWRDRRRLRDVPRSPETSEEAVHGGPAPDAVAFRFRLLEAMQMLGPMECEVVLLHDLEGWTHPEIAEALGLSVVMSRQHLFQARRKLRVHLECAHQDGDNARK